MIARPIQSPFISVVRHGHTLTHTTRLLITVALIFVLLVQCTTTAQAQQTYEEDRGSSSWEHDSEHYQEYDDDQQDQQRNWRRHRRRPPPHFDMLPGYQDWDNEPIVTALDNFFSATMSLIRAVFGVLHTLYRRLVVIFTLPYDVFIAPVHVLFRLYSKSINNKKSTALVLASDMSFFADDDFNRLYDTWTGLPSRAERFQKALYYVIAFLVPVTLAAKCLRRLAGNAEVREFMSRRGHGFVLAGTVAFLIDAWFILAETMEAVFQLCKAAFVLTIYLTVWFAVPAGMVVVMTVVVIIFAWVFRDWTKDKR